MAIEVVENASVLPMVVHQPVSRGLGADRIHYLDNLRALAMLLGVFLHGAFAYANPAQSVWLATDPTSSVVIDGSIWFVHLFRMSLFFLLSGYFAKLLIERKGVKKFLWNRTLRIAFPFVLFYPLLLAAMTIVIVFGLAYVKEPKGLMAVIASASKQSPEASGSRPMVLMHLWFLYYLFCFSLMGAIVALFRWPKVDRLFHGLFERPWSLMLVPVALIPGVLGAGAPLPAPESFVPMWWPFAYYGLFYLTGWQWYGREHHLEDVRPYLWYIVAGSALLFVPYYVYMPVLDLSVIMRGSVAPSGWATALECLLTAYLSVTLTVASLLLGKTYLSRKNPWLKFIADSAYWVYLVHLPIAIFLQTLFIPLDWNVWLKASATILGTFVSCLGTYVVFVRYTPIGWLLNGKREFP